MTRQKFRLPVGGLIDRLQPVEFRFDGKSLEGYVGDTLASALLANGVRLVGRSFKYHRPRGIFTSGSEEPNALVELREGARREPNTRATVTELFEGLSACSQNRWPSLRFDWRAVNGLVSALLPAGFYYKTFMWPPSFWEKIYEPQIRRAAGLGRASSRADPDHYEASWHHCDLLVIGAGPAGLMAASAAARSGARVLIADEQARFGGTLLDENVVIDGFTGIEWARACIEELNASDDVTLLPRTTVFGHYDHNVFGAVERVNDHLAEPPPGQPRQRLWHIVARQVVLASGAMERGLSFTNNDRPGVMLAGAVRSYVNRYAVAPGESAIVFANNDSGIRTVRDLKSAGLAVRALVDVRSGVDSVVRAELEDSGTQVFDNSVVFRAHGRTQLRGARIAPRGGGQGVDLDCDLLCLSGGHDPRIHLTSHTGVKPVFDNTLGCFVAGDLGDTVSVVGAASGRLDIITALRTGYDAGREAALRCGLTLAREQPVPEVTGVSAEAASEALWQIAGATEKAFVDLQNDVTVDDVALAAREGFDSVELMKRYTTLGMATDQGKTSNVAGLAILGEQTQREMADVGTTTFRPPYTPVAIGAFAGDSRGRHFQPVRYSPLHEWAVDLGAEFLEVGLWYRSRYFPKVGEDMAAASEREVLATRRSVGVCDVSTLGKIDIQGPDAGEFLNVLYSNGFKTLQVGKARYGLMLREDGILYDDGTASRLATDRYLMTTTTHNAAGVLAHMEFHHQCVWPGLDVQFCSVTEQWAGLAVAGPRSRELLSRVLPQISLDNDAFPYMAAGEFTFQGMPLRLFRISFSGELGYEINVPAGYARAFADHLMEVGAAFDITPYGSEALDVMRIEKGHVTAKELNGQTTPHDLGLGRMVSHKKDYIGRFLSGRPGMIDANRQRIVGLIPERAGARLFAGAHLVGPGKSAIAKNDEGFVTSVTYSPALGHWIGLALVNGGEERIGEKMRAIEGLRGMEEDVELVSPLFLDPEGVRLRG